MLVASSELVEFEEGFSNELCYTCTCSSDGKGVDCSRRGLTDVPDGFSEQVKQLNLSTNELVTFPQKIKRFQNLVSLDLSGNRLSDLPEDALQTLSALEVLDLSKNNFESWLNLNPNEVLQPATNLKILDLSHNKFNTLAMIICLTLTLVLVNVIRASMKRRLAAIQEERERQMAEARDRLRQLRIAAEQQALINTPDPRDLISPPSYTEALSMPKLNASSHSLNETSSGRSRKKRKTRKTKSSSDLLDETERNGDMRVVDIELEEASEDSRRSRRRRRPRKYGSHEIAELDQSPGARRRRISEYDPAEENTTVEVEVEVSRPLRPRVRRYSSDEDEPRESDF
ncbi:leucine rich repeat domain-containing protein [Phthorimaea operculella]|nr:leucine rich repeat domain-containing protein [Phthorimaea operculella]